MLVLPAYFDGETVKNVDNYKFSKDQKLMITVLDEAEEKKINGIKTLRGILSKYVHTFFHLVNLAQILFS